MKLFLRPNKIIFIFVAVFGLGGLFLGIPEMFIGLVFGYFTGCLCFQIKNDKEVRNYLENPGPSTFDEGEPGLAAFCALGIYVLSKASPKILNGEADAARVAGTAVSVFSRQKSIIRFAEQFSRLALERLPILNPDLLSESLFARCQNAGDRALLGSELLSMALGREAQREALYIRQFLDPSYKPPLSENPEDDPWIIMGISRGSSYNETKSAFRKLAIMFHPDNQTGFNEKEREKMGETFMRIRDAYRTITREIIGNESHNTGKTTGY